MKKKILILLSLIIMFTLTGCSNIQTLTCKAEENSSGIETTSDLKVKIKENEVINMNLVMVVTFPESLNQYKQAMINQVLQKTNQVYTTKDGFKAIFDMNSSFFKELGLSKNVSYGELKQVLELQGYICKDK